MAEAWGGSTFILLASARITGCGLWTLDRRLQRTAKDFSIPSQ